VGASVIPTGESLGRQADLKNKEIAINDVSGCLFPEQKMGSAIFAVEESGEAPIKAGALQGV